MRRFRKWFLANWWSLFLLSYVAYLWVQLQQVPGPPPELPPIPPAKVVVLPPEPLLPLNA